MPGAVRLGDIAECKADAHGCPACPHHVAGPAVSGSTNVYINSLPAIRLGDPGIHMACCGPNTWKAAQGSPTVYVNGKPLVRHHDQTTHCGGVGKTVKSSPNVIIDGGAGKAQGGKLAKTQDGDAGKATTGKVDLKKNKDKTGWTHKHGTGKDGDVSKDQADKTKARVIQASLLQQAVPPGEKVQFEIDVEAGCQGAVQIEVVAKSGDETKTVKKTSVTADGQKKVLQGSFQAPKLADKETRKVIHIVAKHGDDPPVESGDCVVTESGVVLFLFDEGLGAGDPDPKGTEPTGTRPKTTQRLTADLLQQKKLQGPVKAQVKIGGKNHDVTFNDDGVAVIPPKVDLPKNQPAPGAAYAEADVQVTLVSPAELKKTFKVKAFAPQGG